MTMELPPYLKKLGTVADKVLAGMGVDQPPRLSIKDNRFRLIDGAGNERLVGQMDNGTPQEPGVGIYLDVNVIDTNEHMSKQFRPSDELFDPDNPTPPVCWSDNGIGPSSLAQQPQAPRCLGCPHNEIGSAISKVSGAKMKACRDIRKIAIVVPGVENVVFQFVLTPGSFQNWKQYDKTLKGHGVDVVYVTTRLFFAGQGVLGFKPVSIIDEPTAERIDALQKAKAADFAVGRGDKPNGLIAPPTPESTDPLVPKKQLDSPPPVPLAPGPVVVPAASLPPGPQAGDPGPGASTSVPRGRGRPPKVVAPRANEVVIGPGPVPPQTFAKALVAESINPDFKFVQQPRADMQPDPFAKMYPAGPAPSFEKARKTLHQAQFSPPQAVLVNPQPASFGIQPNPLPPPDELRAAIDAAMNLDVS